MKRRNRAEWQRLKALIIRETGKYRYSNALTPLSSKHGINKRWRDSKVFSRNQNPRISTSRRHRAIRTEGPLKRELSPWRAQHGLSSLPYHYLHLQLSQHQNLKSQWGWSSGYLPCLISNSNWLSSSLLPTNRSDRWHQRAGLENHSQLLRFHPHPHLEVWHKPWRAWRSKNVKLRNWVNNHYALYPHPGHCCC